MKLVNEATKEELEAALAKLNDPYKKFKDALVAGKRVRIRGVDAWASKDDSMIFWCKPAEDYEIEPEYCGYTEEQWQFVIDGGFLIVWQYCKGRQKLQQYELQDILKGSDELVTIVREKGIKQPAFGRDVGYDAGVLIHYKVGNYCMMDRAANVKWDDVDWFIEL